MSLSFVYYSPTVGAITGWSENLGTDVVRLGTMALSASAEQGEAAICGLQLDDPNADVGHDGDAIVGLKQVRITESAAPVGRRRVWTGYVADRTYSRGTGGSPSLIVDAARVIDVSLVDINAFLNFRIFHESDANRPAETDIARVTWLLSHSYVSSTLIDHGLVDSSDGVDMDEVDYRGQHPVDILNDCAQQSGRNYYVYYHEASGDFALAYFRVIDTVNLIDPDVFRLSNVLTDVDNDVTFAPTQDARLVRDPSRIASAVYMPYTGGNVYRSNSDTQEQFGPRDVSAPAANVKTVAQANARADRYLEENASEDDRLTIAALLPKEHVNDWYPGEAVQVRLSHLPGYEAFRYVRALRRNVMQDAATQDYYHVEWECTPLVGTPSGAAGAQQVGVAYSGIPVLPRATTPGNILLAVMFASGNTTRFPFAFRALDNPHTNPSDGLDNPGSPDTPPFSALQTAAWTVLKTSVTDYAGQNIGGPCGHVYGGPHGGTWSGAPYQCTSGLFTAAAWRRVAPGEITTTPAQFSTEITDSQALVFLWELPTTVPPDGTAVELDGTGGGGLTSTAALPTISGNAIAAVQWATAAGHSARVQPSASALISGTSLRGPIKTIPGSHAPTLMNDTVVDSNVQQWGWLIKLPSGGVASASITVPGGAPPYNEINWCGVAIKLPVGIDLPDIPYPAMQSA